MVALAFSDTARREVVPFEPIDPGNVRMYVCGPTVYDEAHIGNARPVVVFDVLFRLLRSVYGAGHVKYVRNITDIDDKIIQRAAENGEPIGALTARVTDGYMDNMRALGCLDPTVQPRATKSSAMSRRWQRHHTASAHITQVRTRKAVSNNTSRASMYSALAMWSA